MKTLPLAAIAVIVVGLASACSFRSETVQRPAPATTVTTAPAPSTVVYTDPAPSTVYVTR